jgi:regulatory protein
LPTVTAVRERRGRARIQIDGEPFAELDASVAAQHGLRVGAMLEDEELREARLSGERPLAMDRALNLLSYRARSAGELRSRLSRAGYVPETVSVVLDRLGELGYLDDAEFARNLAAGRARKGYGPRKAQDDLRRAGVREDIARAAIDAAFTSAGAGEEDSGEDSELPRAREAALRRYNPQQEGSDAVARRVYGFLSRRGFSAVVCAEVARDYRG